MVDTRVEPSSRRRGKPGSVDQSIRNYIAAGKWKPGEQLPTWDNLEQQFKVSRGTITQAMSALKRDGFVVSLGKRRGMVVAESPPCLYQYGLLFSRQPLTAPTPWWPTFCQTMETQAARVAERHGARVKVYYGVGNGLDKTVMREVTHDADRHRLAGVIFGDAPLVGQKSPFMEISVPKVAMMWYAKEDRPFDGPPLIYGDNDTLCVKALDYLQEKGRKRIALLFAGGLPHQGLIAIWNRSIQERGMITHQYWQMCASPQAPVWANNAVHAMFRGPAEERPEALVVVDDHLTEEATLGLLACGLTAPRDVEVLSIANFPSPPTAHVPTKMIGFDCTQIMSISFDYMAQLRAGLTPPKTTYIVPRFEDEPVAPPITH